MFSLSCVTGFSNIGFFPHSVKHIKQIREKIHTKILYLFVTQNPPPLNTTDRAVIHLFNTNLDVFQLFINTLTPSQFRQFSLCNKALYQFCLPYLTMLNKLDPKLFSLRRFFPLDQTTLPAFYNRPFDQMTLEQILYIQKMIVEKLEQIPAFTDQELKNLLFIAVKQGSDRLVSILIELPNFLAQNTRSTDSSPPLFRIPSKEVSGAMKMALNEGQCLIINTIIRSSRFDEIADHAIKTILWEGKIKP